MSKRNRNDELKTMVSIVARDRLEKLVKSTESFCSDVDRHTNEAILRIEEKAREAIRKIEEETRKKVEEERMSAQAMKKRTRDQTDEEKKKTNEYLKNPTSIQEDINRIENLLNTSSETTKEEEVTLWKLELFEIAKHLCDQSDAEFAITENNIFNCHELYINPSESTRGEIERGVLKCVMSRLRPLKRKKNH